MSATGADSALGVQAFFQTGNYEAFQTTTGGTVNQFAANTLAVDGQFHDLVFPIYNVTNRDVVPAFGINLFSHVNDLVINVDQVQFISVPGVPTDYNGNGGVDIADYVEWRKGTPLQNEVVTLGTATDQDYTEWRVRFGKTTASGLALSEVPEPATAFLLLAMLMCRFVTRTRRA
jgi:hypothetical protein